MTANVIIRKGIVIVGLSACAIAQAQEVVIAGTATGLFNNGSTAIQGLSYTGSTFDVTSSPTDGFYAIGNNAGTPNLNNLGSFTLSGSPASYTGDTFTLAVTFSSPTGIQGSSTASYTADLYGSVVQNAGGVEVVFANSPQNFTFSNRSGTGGFDLAVNTVSITAGSVSPVTGFGTAHEQAVPEPAPFAMMLTGLVGVGYRRFRKK